MARKKKKKEVSVEGVYQQAISIAADYFRAGNSDTVVAQVIKETFTNLTDANIQLVIHKSSQQIAEQFSRDRTSVVSLHVKRYNQEIKRLMEQTYDGLIDEDMDEGDGPKDLAAKRRKLRIYTLMTALDVLFAKEKVLQMHNKDNQIRIYNKLNAKKKSEKVLFNLSGLSLDEKIELLSLMSKAKRTQNEVFGVKLIDMSKVEVTEDIEHEEVKEPANIEKIEKIIHQQPKLVRPPVMVEDITRKIQETLMKKAEKELKKRNGMRGGPHIVDANKDL